MNVHHYLVAATAGARLDKFISEQVPGLSRTRVQKLIEDGLVTVNNRPAKPNLRLTEGDKVDVVVHPEKPLRLTAEEIPLSIIYEDDDVLVIEKPAGLAVHPAPGHTHHTLLNAVLNYLPGIAGDTDPDRPGLVHRLDKDTSGLIIVAKNRRAQADLSRQFKARSVMKTYLVLVRGRLVPEQGIIEAGIGRHPRYRQQMAVVTRGREARTAYKVIRYIGNYSLLEIRPETGRTHQIRVHLAAIGFPVVGDATYGKTSPFLSRQFLHAHRIGFRLPSSGKYVEFESPLPPDLQAALTALALER